LRRGFKRWHHIKRRRSRPARGPLRLGALRVLDNILGLMKTHQAGMRPVARP
jgi:hypothetical protein